MPLRPKDTSVKGNAQELSYLCIAIHLPSSKETTIRRETERASSTMVPQNQIRHTGRSMEMEQISKQYHMNVLKNNHMKYYL
jgi:hypothetical protein